MKRKFYKSVLSAVVFFYITSLFAQSYEKKYYEKFNVEKDIEISINASYSEISVINWDKNEVEVSAYIEIEGISKEAAEKYFKNWNFEALGNKTKVKISMGNNNFFPFQNEFDYLKNSKINSPNINIVDSIYTDKFMLSEMDFNDEFYNTDLEFLDSIFNKKGKNLVYLQGGGINVKIKNKEDWEKFKNSKNHQKWKEYIQKNREKIRREMEISREKIKREAEKNFIYFKKKDREKMLKQREKARQEMAKIKLNFSTDTDNLMIDGKKVKVTKKIEIKVPKDATFNLNTRHCRVKLPNTVAFGNVKYGSFNATNLMNSRLNINYSPVTIKDLNACNLFLNNVTDAKIASVTNTKLNSNYSNINIENIHNNVDISTKFGEIVIQKVHSDFNKLYIDLNYTNALIQLQNLDKNLIFQIQSMNNLQNNPSMKLNILNEKSKKINGNFTIQTKDSSFIINGKYSQITVNQ